MKEIKHRGLWVAALLQLVALIFLSVLAYQSKYFPLDLVITHKIQSLANPVLDQVFYWVSYPGFPPQLFGFLGLILGVLIFTKHYLEAKIEILVMFAIGPFGYLFKILVNRPRATRELIHVVHQGLEGGKYSFPAGHVQSYVAILGFLWFFCLTRLPKKSWWRKIQLIFYPAMIVLIAPSRVYMGEHWTSDAVGGYLVGGIVLAITIWFYDRYLPK